MLPGAQRDRVVRPAAGPSGEPDDVIGQDPRLLGHVQAQPEREDGGRSERIDDDLRGLGVAVDVPFGRRRRVAWDPERATHEHQSAKESRELRLALECDGQVRHRAERDQGQLARPAPSVIHDDVGRMAFAHRPTGRRERRIAQALRSVGLRGHLDRAHERDLPSDGDLDVRPSGQLEDRERVRGDLVGLDISGAAGDGDDLRVGRGDRVEQGEAVVDPGVAVDEDGGRRGHRPMLAEPGRRGAARCQTA